MFAHLSTLARCVSSRVAVRSVAAFHVQVPANQAATEATTSGFVPSYTELKQIKKEQPRGLWLHSLTPEAVIEFSRPTKTAEGRWRAPILTPRQINVLRRAAETEGRDFVIPRKPIKTIAPTKLGRKHKEKKVERLQTIKKNMAGMDKMVADHKAAKLKARKEAREAKKFFQHPLN